MPMSEIHKLKQALLEGKPLPRLTGCYGRIIRTRYDRPLALAEENERRAVMVMGPSGLKHILLRPGYEMLLNIGYTAGYIKTKLDKGFRFELLIFKLRREELKVASWRNVLTMACACYPEAAHLFREHAREMKAKSIAEFEAMAGFSFAEVDNLGAEDPRYMTMDRLLTGDGSALSVRRFLYHRLRLSELYTGDGFTKLEDGSRGIREYIITNRSVQELEDYGLFTLDVNLPTAMPLPSA